MGVVEHAHEISHERSPEVVHNEAEAVQRPPSLSLVRIAVGTGLAGGTAFLGLFLGLTLLAATAIGAAVGGSAVAFMAARQAVR